VIALVLVLGALVVTTIGCGSESGTKSTKSTAPTGTDTKTTK
jgi:hypothetical protein